MMTLTFLSCCDQCVGGKYARCLLGPHIDLSSSRMPVHAFRGQYMQHARRRGGSLSSRLWRHSSNFLMLFAAAVSTALSGARWYIPRLHVMECTLPWNNCLCSELLAISPVFSQPSKMARRKTPNMRVYDVTSQRDVITRALTTGGSEKLVTDNSCCRVLLLLRLASVILTVRLSNGWCLPVSSRLATMLEINCQLLFNHPLAESVWSYRIA